MTNEALARSMRCDTGQYLMQHKLYDNAEYCFERAGPGYELQVGISRSFKLRSVFDCASPFTSALASQVDVFQSPTDEIQ